MSVVRKTDMGTLSDFLLSRIAEDEAIVRDYVVAGHEQIPGDCWGPARVLAECEAKRRIVEIHWDTDPSCARCADPDDEMSNETWPCSTLRMLALPYADHPDCREEWKP